MAIIKEDGTVVTGANSYVTEAELTAYATARGITISGNTEQLLIRAMDYIEGLDFIGLKYTQDQSLQWPRVHVVVDGYLNDIDTIPTELKDGLMEVALSIDNGQDQLADVARSANKKTVGPISVEYSAGGRSTTLVRKINNKLRKLLVSGGSSFKVGRG